MDRMGLDLKVEIGVNKFKNGNAQFYHKLGVAPKVPPGGFEFLNFDVTSSLLAEIHVQNNERREMLDKRQNTIKELQEIGTFPRRFLKKQVTNDKSAPFVSGKSLQARN